MYKNQTLNLGKLSNPFSQDRRPRKYFPLLSLSFFLRQFEPSKKYPPELRTRHPESEASKHRRIFFWREVAGLRVRFPS